MWVIEAVTDLRLAPEKELAGLDLEEHGASAYPEYVLNGDDGTPKTLEDAKRSWYAAKRQQWVTKFSSNRL